MHELIHPISISTPFAVGDVWCYLIDDEKKVLVDCGHYDEEAFRLVEQHLNKLGLSSRQIDEIWLTHGHPDHFGQASRLAELSGARVVGHAAERSNFAGNDDGDLFEVFFHSRGIPREHISEMTRQLDWLQQYQQPLQPDWITEETRLTSGRLSFRVAHTPGHAPGHLCFYGGEADGKGQGEGRQLIFGGDLLLERISTNALINFDPESGRRNKSLLQYRRSLKWISGQEGIVLPGHGPFISDIRTVAEHHLQEHEKRYQKIKRLLDKRPYTLYELALQTFPEAIKSGALFLVLSEIQGYLDWGIEEGAISREGTRYTVKKF